MLWNPSYRNKLTALFLFLDPRSAPPCVESHSLARKRKKDLQGTAGPAEAGSGPAPARPHPVAASQPASAIAHGLPSRLSTALTIISEESGLAVADLTDSTAFGDVGIDSLLGLTISARFKEELDMDLDFNAFFFDYPTVGDLKGFLGEPATSSHGTSTPASTEVGSATPRSSATGTTTPSGSVDFHPPKVDFQRALQIVSEESGVATDDLTEDTNFADSGVDSLLSLVIVSRFRDELELDIQHESLFLECPTVSDLRQLLLGGTAEREPVSSPVLAAHESEAKDLSSQRTQGELAALATRKKAVDDYVQTYTAGFSRTEPFGDVERAGRRREGCSRNRSIGKSGGSPGISSGPAPGRQDRGLPEPRE